MVVQRSALDLGVVLLCAVQFVDVLGVTSATVAIPAIVDELSAGPIAVIAIATAYATCFGGFLVVGSRLGDRWGHRRVLLLGLLVFAGVAVIGATASTSAQLVVTRAAQGFAAAISIPCALRLLLHLSPESGRRTSAIAVWSAAGAAAGAAGLLLGGFVTDWWSWRGIFWVNLPVGLALAALIGWRIDDAPTALGSRSSLNVGGGLLLVSAVTSLVGGAALVEYGDTRVVGAAVALGGLGLGLAFSLQQRHASDPLIPPEAWRSSTLRRGAGLSFVNTATTSSGAVLLTLHLQHQLGMSPLQAGLQLVPLSLAVIIGSAAAKPLSRRLTQPGLAGFGLLIIAGGNLALALAHQHTAGITGGVILAGFGLGLASVAATTIGTDVKEQLSGAASGIVNTAAQTGTALGIAVFLTLASAIGPEPTGTTTAWGVIAAVAAVAAGYCQLIRHRNPAQLPSQAASRSGLRTPLGFAPAGTRIRSGSSRADRSRGQSARLSLIRTRRNPSR